MKIEIWSDFMCPFCYIGKVNLENALKYFEGKDTVEIDFKSFELNPDAKKHYDENIDELIANKYGIPLEQAKSANAQIVAQAKEVGLNFNFKDLKPTNTFDAHRLTHFAKHEGKSKELSEKILKAYLVDGLNVSDYEVLSSLGEDIGLDKDRVLEVLENNEYALEVRDDEEMASRIGVSSVPFFVFDNKYAISGAQPKEVFLEVVKKLESEM